MDNNLTTTDHDKPSGVEISPPWRELLLRFVRHGRRFLFPVKPSSRAGIGAVPNEQGVAFRVWAPHASHVMVSGSFNRRCPAKEMATGQTTSPQPKLAMNTNL